MNAKVKKKLMFISSNICAGCKGIFERRFFLLRYGFSRKDFSKMFIHRFLREMLSHFSAFDHFGLHFPLFWYVRFFDSDKWGFLIPFFIWTLMCDSNLWFTIPPPGNFTFFSVFGVKSWPLGNLYMYNLYNFKLPPFQKLSIYFL